MDKAWQVANNSRAAYELSATTTIEGWGNYRRKLTDHLLSAVRQLLGLRPRSS